MRRIGIGEECDMTTHLIKLIRSSCGAPPRPEVQFLLYKCARPHVFTNFVHELVTNDCVQYSISSEPWLVFAS